MFSASLVSMMLHTVWSDLQVARVATAHPSMNDVADDIGRFIGMYLDSLRPRPSIPITGTTEKVGNLDGYVTAVELETASGTAAFSVFGRVPIDVLGTRLKDTCNVDASREYLDVGTPIDPAQFTMPVDLSGCIGEMGVLSHSDPALLKVVVALIDVGDSIQGARPDDVNGRVHHVVTKDIQFSGHAARVFETLLRRLRHHRVIDEVEFIGALVPPPRTPIGRHCFEHANVVELQQTLNALSTHIAGINKPVVANISLGTHVGPHDGTTPLELFISRSMPLSRQRHFICSAGNDGMNSLSAQCFLEPDIPEYLRVRTPPTGCAELLVEMWWQEASTGSVQASVEFTGANGRQRGSAVVLSAATAGATMQVTGPGFPGVVCESLYHGHYAGDLHCISLALSTNNIATLADMTVDIELLSPHGGLGVSSWIVLPRHPRCEFVGSGLGHSSITMPATMENAVSVVGVEPNGLPWKHNSRGGSAPFVPQPRISHLAAFGSAGHQGTSYAAPRVSSDLVERILRAFATPQNGNALAIFLDPDDAIDAILKKNSAGYTGPRGATWHHRTGFGSIVKGP